jgi:hypothetical protein
MAIHPLHRRMMEIGFSTGEELGLALAGGYAMQAHELLERQSKDVDFATSLPKPLSEIVDGLARAYRAAGYTVEILQVTPRMARMDVHTPEGDCEVDLLKEALAPPAQLELGPVVSFEDAVGLKVRAIAGRTLPRDFIDVHAAREHFSWRRLEQLCRIHYPDFELEAFADRVGAIEFLGDRSFHAYGLDDERIAEIRRWAVAWRDDIQIRLASDPEGPSFGPARFDWDSYVNERD